MKIIIAGPIPSFKKSGGVAVFDENLALTLARMSKDNQILLAVKSPNLIKDQKKYPSNINVANIRDLRKFKTFNPDVIISSLWYSLFFCSNVFKAKKVHILHGFTNYRDYTDLKVFIMHKIDKKIRKNFDFLLANSDFTKYINENIFGLKVDGVFQIGLAKDQIKKLTSSVSSNNKKIIYIGRLVSAKKVDKLIASVSKIKDENYDECQIIGYGPEKEALQQLAKRNPKIHFIGAVTPQKTSEYYKKARVFVSLNPSEPFGITYEEAIAAGLYVVAPNTGGQVEFLKKFPERSSLVNINNIDSVTNAIQLGLNKKLEKLSKKEIEKLYYSNTVDQIFKVIRNEA